MQTQSNGDWEMQARLALAEFKNARNTLSALESECEAEKNTWRSMCGYFIPLCLVFLMYLANNDFIPYMTSSAESLGFGFGLPASIILVVALSLWMGCAPAGFMGCLRAMRRSGWFVAGTGAIGLVILAVFIAIPIMMGPHYFIKQWNLVHELDSKIAKQRKKLKVARLKVSLADKSYS